MCDQRFLDGGKPLSHPDRKYEGLTSPFLPRLAQVIDVRVALAMVGAEDQCGIADYQSRVRVGPAFFFDVADLGIAGDELRARTPDVLEQQLEQCDARHRASADDDAATRELGGRAPG